MSTTNKNYPLIKETDSNGQPLNAYDQLVTESNNFRRAVDKDIQETDNKVSSLEQKVSLTQSGIATVPQITANQTTSFTVNFPKVYDSIPRVIAIIDSNFPNMKRFITVSSVGTQTFQLNVYAEGNATNLKVQWIANGY